MYCILGQSAAATVLRQWAKWSWRPAKPTFVLHKYTVLQIHHCIIIIIIITIIIMITITIIKGVHPLTGREGPEGEYS
jgi:hypothetical protein